MYSTEIDTIEEKDWSSLLKQFEDATVYQTWSCGAVLWGEENLSHAVLREGEEVVGIAQVALRNPPVISAGTALIFWGPLWRRHGRYRDIKLLSYLTEFLRTEYIEKRGLYLRVIPNELESVETEVRPVLESAGFSWHGRFYKTYILDITPTPDSLRKQLRQKWRNCLNRAEQADLIITEGTSLESYDVFCGIFREMKERKQISGISLDPGHLRDIQRELPDFLKAQIFLCYKGQNPVAGAVVSAIGDTAILLLAATNAGGRKVMASYFLQWKIIEWLKSMGIRSYDLGGHTPSAPQVNHFKAGLGGYEVSHSGMFEQCTNPRSLLFDRSLGLVKDYRKRLQHAMEKWTKQQDT
jgi:lipid II:glycine glycyltransferase (peptidoglycan interpeptide bridge formation enzyme)